MLTAVLILNLLLALLCWYAAWQVWVMGRSLARMADCLDVAERNTHYVLCGAPEAISGAQAGVYQLREKYQQLEGQISRLQQVLALLSWGQAAWLRVSPMRRQRRAKWAKRGKAGSR